MKTRSLAGAVWILLISMSGIAAASEGDWLLGNITQSGVVDSLKVSGSTPYQATSESLATLTILGNISAPTVSLARNYVLAESFHNTENLSRQIVAGVTGGSNVLSRIDDLISSQNPKDGGFGELAGWQSTPIDTAFALEALSVAGKANDRSVGSVVAYLTATQNADGSWRSDREASPVYVTALALHALHQVRNSRNVSVQISAASAWLLAQRGSNGLWSDTALSAQVLSALIPTFNDISPLQLSLDALGAQKASNGSFNNDAWDTAWALRALFLAGQPRTNPDEIVIRGRVLDGDSLMPLEGVSVTLSGAQTGAQTTTTTGTFAFRNLLAGNYTLTLTREGFGTLKATMSASKGSYLDLGDVKMLRSGTATTGAIRGVVTASDNGQPIPNATLTTATGTVVTGTDGSYQLNDVVPGNVQLQVSASGYRDGTAQVTVTAGSFVVYSPVLVRVELPDPQATAVTGKVVDTLSGSALAGVTVTLIGPQTYTLVTSANGLFAFNGISDGDYTLRTTADNYADVTAAVPVPLGVAVPVGTLRLSAPNASATTGSVRGVVTDALNGSAIAGAYINIPGMDAVQTATDGTYLITDVPAGEIQLNAFSSGYQTETSTGTVVAGSTLYFSPRLSLAGGPLTVNMQGVATDAVTGNPVQDVFVFVYQPNYRWNWTDARGRYAIDGITAGEVLVKVSADGYDDIFIGFKGSAGNTIAFSPKMYRTGTSPADANSSSLIGRVVSAATGEPVSGAQVRLTWTNLDATHENKDVTLTVGSDGAFQQTGIRAWDVNVEVTADGFDPYVSGMSLAILQETALGDVRLHPTDIVALVPDLEVSALDISAVTRDPQTLAISGYVTATVQNIGTADAGSFTALVDGGTPAGAAWSDTVSSLAIGESASVVIPVEGLLPFRDAPLRVLADSEGVVVENNKTNNSRSSCDNCRAAPLPASSRQVKLKWWWNKTGVMATPLVAPLVDTNGDGQVDHLDRTAIVVVSLVVGRGYLHVIWGDNGTTFWEKLSNTNSPEASQTPAIGDIDGDGRPEIVYMRYGGGMVALNGDGTTKWISNVPAYVGRTSSNHISLVDMDGDGKSEIVLRNQIFNYDGTLRTTLPMTYATEYQPVPVDLDGDGRPEIVIGAFAFKADGTLLWHALGGGYSAAAADFNHDGKPEIVTTAPSLPGRLALLTAEGTRLWQVTMGDGGGAPAIFDADGDGTPEIGVATIGSYRVYRADGSLMWSKSTYDASGRTTSAIFDIQGDGLPEVFYQDTDFMRIFDGKTGAELVKFVNVNATGNEYSVIADIDQDGHAEFLSMGTHTLNNGLGIRAYEGINDDWMPARGIWNQHNYYVNNVGDDGQIPATEIPVWKTHNTFHQNIIPDRDPLESANLTVGYLRVLDHGIGQPISILARVGNAGLLTAKAGGTVKIYAGTPETGLLLGSVTLPVLGVGQSMDVRLDNVAGLQASTVITAVVMPKAGELDCRTDDDRHSWAITVTDQQGVASVETDAPIYGPDSDVSITLNVQNKGALDATFSAAVRIVDANGVVVAELPAESNFSLAGDGSLVINRLWNTGEILAGDYQVVAELYAANGTLLIEARSGFRITPADGVELANISIATDKPSYNTTDSVAVEGLASNLSSNVLLSGAQVSVTLLNDSGVVIASWVDTAADLAAGNTRQYATAVALSGSSQGAFTVRARLLSATGASLATAEATFEVAEQLARSLQGEVTIERASLIVGEAQGCSGVVSALGTQGVTDLPVRMLLGPLTDGGVETVVGTWAMSLAPGQSQPLSATINTNGRLPGDYACVLQYQDGGEWRSLGYKAFALAVPPVILGGSVTLASAEVHRPDTQTCTYRVTNSGGGTAQGLLVERSLRGVTGSVVSSQSTSVTLAGNSSQTFVQSYDTTSLSTGDYRCHLETVWSSQRAVQGDAAWSLLPPVCPVPQPVPASVDVRDDQDLIVNGSFEEYGSLNHGIWGTFPSIPGWDAKYGPLEIQTSSFDGIPQKDGNARLELDSQNNSEVAQSVPTDVGGRYELLIAYTPRITVLGTDTNDVEIWWDGHLVKTLTGDAQDWREERVEVVATTSLTTLTLKAVGASDQASGLIDQVRMYCISCRRANLINNNSFERHPRLAGVASGNFLAIPGWRATTDEPFEVQHDGAHKVNVIDGHAQVELDALANARMRQDVGTASGYAYALDIFYAPRVPLPKQADSNQVEVWWAGQLIDTLRGDKNEWYMKRYTVSAVDDASRLEFRAAGASDTFGGVIDNVSLSCLIPTTNLVAGNFLATGVQDLATEMSRNYTLSFRYSPQTKPPAGATNTVEVRWGNQLLATLTGTKAGWQTKTFKVEATESLTQLSIVATGRTDGPAALIESVSLVLEPRLPIIASTPVTMAAAGEAWQYALDVQQVDVGAAHLTLEQAPMGMTLGADGVLRWNNPVQGEYPIRVRISDGCGGTTVQSFTLKVTWPEWCPLQ